MESAGAQYHSANPEAGAMTYRLYCSIVRGYFSMGAPTMLPYSVHEPS